VHIATKLFVACRRGEQIAQLDVEDAALCRKIGIMNMIMPALVATLAVMPNLALAADSPEASAQQEIHFETRTPVAAKIDYLLFLPQGYQESKQNWPLMLFLHGSGESGTNVAKVKAHGPPKIVESKPDFPFILVSPQSPGRGWNIKTLTALLDDVTAKYRVDTNRIYLTGLSMGGFGTWSLAAAHPEKFAAIVPICGGGNPADGKKLAGLPIWVFHGAKDPTVPVERSREMVAAIKAAGGNVKYTEYPEGKHDCWTETYNNPELYQWLLAQKR
jgi:predicted peptidase